MSLLLAKDIMSSPVITVRDDEIISKFITVLLDSGISGVPVINGKNVLVGIITKTDLITFELERVLNNLYSGDLKEIITEMSTETPSLASLTGQSQNSRTLLVKDMMIHNVFTVSEETPIRDICTLMQQEKIRHVIIKKDKHVAGIITATDIIKLVSNSKTAFTQEDCR